MVKSAPWRSRSSPRYRALVVFLCTATHVMRDVAVSSVDEDFLPSNVSTVQWTVD